MKFNLLIIVGFTFLSISLISCKKEVNTPDSNGDVNASTGNVKVNLESVWNSTNDFALGTTYTQPASGDELTFSTLKYYVSNFKLKRSNGTWWSHANSYFLVNETDQSSTILELNKVPQGTYTDIAFTFGVDSAKNVSGPQTGALSTSNGMFWSWNSGYIMLKAEGTSPQSTGGAFAYHLGGFEGNFNIVKEMSFSFGDTPLTISTTGIPNVFMNINVSKMFEGIGSVSEGNSHSIGNLSLSLGNAFRSGISFNRLEN